MPLEIGTPPEHFPARLAANKRRLRHRMFHLHTRLLPPWPDLKYLDTLANDTKANIQLGPDMRRGPAFLNEGIHYLLDPLPLDIVQRHVLAT